MGRSTLSAPLLAAVAWISLGAVPAAAAEGSSSKWTPVTDSIYVGDMANCRLLRIARTFAASETIDVK
jgi:hypothetical protein